MATTTTIAWAPGKKVLYEALLETLFNIDLENHSNNMEELSDIVDSEFQNIAFTPQRFSSFGLIGGLECRGKMINFPLNTRDKYFVWYTFDDEKNEILVHFIGRIKPFLFS